MRIIGRREFKSELMQKQTRETMRQNVDNPRDDDLNEMTEKKMFNFRIKRIKFQSQNVNFP